MPKLRDRGRQIPNGMFFCDPLSRWQSPPWASFEQIVQGLVNFRAAHKETYIRAGKALDYDGCAAEVDFYVANLCQRMGWTDFIEP